MIRLSEYLCIAVGLVLILLGAFYTQAFEALGVSLIRFDGRYELFTVVEIEIYRGTLVISGFVLIIATIAWMSAGTNSAWRKFIEDDYTHFLGENAASWKKYNKFILFWTGITFIVLMALVITMSLSHKYGEKDVLWFNVLALENGVWETLTAITLAIAGVVLALAVRRLGKGFRLAGLPALLLGLLLIVGAGEEISWGQHWIGFETPDFLNTINSQNEFNFHNINKHLFNHLQVIVFLLYAGIFPILALLFLEIRYVFDRLLIPLCPFASSILSVLSVSISSHISAWLMPGEDLVIRSKF